MEDLYPSPPPTKSRMENGAFFPRERERETPGNDVDVSHSRGAGVLNDVAGHFKNLSLNVPL